MEACLHAREWSLHQIQQGLVQQGFIYRPQDIAVHLLLHCMPLLLRLLHHCHKLRLALGRRSQVQMQGVILHGKGW